MTVHTLTLGDYGVNCYILSQDGQCLIVDPGYEAKTVATFIAARQLTPLAILLTHGHFDHVGAVKPLAQLYGCPVYLNEKELSLPPQLTAGSLYFTDSYTEEAELQLGSFSCRVLFTPGHTPGSVCLMFGSHLLTGDTLFAGSMGRTDLPGGNLRDMRASLALLRALPGDFTVYPGHGPASTLSQERATNPYL